MKKVSIVILTLVVLGIGVYFVWSKLGKEVGEDRTKTINGVPTAYLTQPPESGFYYQGASDYTKEGYDLALKSGKPVVLYFHANWCPTCKTQKPINEEIFVSFGDRIVVLVANFNDSETTKEDEEIAKGLRVPYQHTYVFYDASGKEVGRYTGPLTRDQLKERIGELLK